MGIPNLPLDIWLAIIDHLSLNDLPAVYNAVRSTTDVGLSVTTRSAIKIISTMLAHGTAKFSLVFSHNGPCHKFHMRNPRAGQYRHQLDHGKGPPCGGEYSPQFPQTIEYSRSFRSQTVDATKTEMTILANNGKSFERRCCRRIRLLPNDTGPSELIEVSVDFFIRLTTAGKLRLEFHTLNDVIKDTYTESSHSPSHFTRTVAHDISLRRAKWVDKDERFIVELPKSWFEFWISGIRAAVTTFSKELVNLNLPGTVDEWQWNMLSFKTEWNLPLSVFQICSRCWIERQGGSFGHLRIVPTSSLE